MGAINFRDGYEFDPGTYATGGGLSVYSSSPGTTTPSGNGGNGGNGGTTGLGGSGGAAGSPGGTSGTNGLNGAV
jgi:hypothetical protein